MKSGVLTRRLSKGSFSERLWESVLLCWCRQRKGTPKLLLPFAHQKSSFSSFSKKISHYNCCYWHHPSCATLWSPRSVPSPPANRYEQTPPSAPLSAPWTSAAPDEQCLRRLYTRRHLSFSSCHLEGPLLSLTPPSSSAFLSTPLTTELALTLTPSFSSCFLLSGKDDCDVTDVHWLWVIQSWSFRDPRSDCLRHPRSFASTFYWLVLFVYWCSPCTLVSVGASANSASNTIGQQYRFVVDCVYSSVSLFRSPLVSSNSLVLHKLLRR